MEKIDDPQEEREERGNEEQREGENEEQQEKLTAIEKATMIVGILAMACPEILRTTPKITPGEDIKQQLKTGFIVGLMSTLGAITGNIIMMTLLAKGNTMILDILNFETPTIIWTIIAGITAIIGIQLLFQKETKIIGAGKMIAIATSTTTGIHSYTKNILEQKGEKTTTEKILLSNTPFYTPLSALLWVWDEFDDFQDGWNRIKKKTETPDITDTMELWLLPFILGLFGAWMGIDQLLITKKIPGRWGFAKYVSEQNFPPPWDVVMNAIYEIIAFIIGNVIASGAKGIGWIFYTIASVIASILMSTILNNVFSMIFS